MTKRTHTPRPDSFVELHKTPEVAITDHPSDHCLEALCNRCGHVVDAVCPDCSSNVEASGALAGSSCAAGRSTLGHAEFYRRLITMLQNSRNTKFTLVCYLVATGDAYADGVSMTEVAKQWGVKKATVSKQCRHLCAYLGIIPSAYMRKEETAKKFRISNRRPSKLPTEPGPRLDK